jgi:hypothetical protein
LPRGGLRSSRRASSGRHLDDGQNRSFVAAESCVALNFMSWLVSFS